MKWSFAAVVTWVMIGGMLLFIPPAQVANIIVPNWYLPLLLLWCIANGVSMFASTKRMGYAVLWSVFSTGLLVFQLHRVLNWFSFALLFIPIIIGFVIYRFFIMKIE